MWDTAKCNGNTRRKEIKKTAKIILKNKWMNLPKFDENFIYIPNNLT